MRIAAFCFFAPAAFSLGLRRWLLGKESTGEALLHFGTAALWRNALALALLDARFHVEVPVMQALSQSGLFALKYLALTCALAMAGVLAERLLARAQAAFRLPEWLACSAGLWAALLAAVTPRYFLWRTSTCTSPVTCTPSRRQTTCCAP